MNSPLLQRLFAGVKVMHILLVGAFSVLSGCAISYTITPESGKTWPATSSVEIIYDQPDRPYITVATFVGSERSRCPGDRPFCALGQKAKALGAHAVWIKAYKTTHYPGDWVEYRGRLLRIYPYTIQTVRGEFIRYQAPPAPFRSSTPAGSNKH